MKERIEGGKLEHKKKAVRVWETERLREKLKARKRQWKREKKYDSYPAVSGEYSGWLGADVSLLGVFIDLLGFNP